MGPKKVSCCFQAPKKSKRKTFAIKEKVSLIEEATKPCYSQIEAAKKHGIKQTTLACILAANTNNEQSSKHLSHGKEHVLEDQLHEWFLKKRSQSLLMDRPLLRKQAEQLATKLGLQMNIQFSAGWLIRFRARYGISFKKSHVEQQSADERLTVLVSANKDGSEKPSLVVTEKSGRPKGFPNKLGLSPSAV